MIFEKAGKLETQALTLSGAVPAVTDKTRSGINSGRFAVEIQASGSDCYIGGEDVTEENGYKITDGQSKFFLVNRPDAVYVTGTGKAIIVDYYE